MTLPSLQVLGIAANGDPSLFESLMARVGFRIVPHDDDPHNQDVHEDVIAAVASTITENTHHGVRLSPYHKKARAIAENAGYVVVIENCGPPGADPCNGDLEGGMGDSGTPLDEIDEMGGEGGATMIVTGDIPPVEDEESSEVQQVAALPIGTELAAEILAVIKGDGPAALMGGDEMGGEMEMGGDEMDDEMDGGEEMDGEKGGGMGEISGLDLGDGPEMDGPETGGEEFGPEEELPPEPPAEDE